MKSKSKALKIGIIVGAILLSAISVKAMEILKEENQADYFVLLITQGQLANAGLRRFPGEPALANLSDGP